MKKPLNPQASDPNRLTCRGILRICALFCIICTVIYIPLFYSISVREGSDAPQERNFTWTVNSTRDVATYVQPENVTAIIPNENLCWNVSTVNNSSNTTESQPTLLIIVCSAVGNFREREAIRQTWMSVEPNETAPFVVKKAFLLGRTNNATWQNDVLAESIVHGDIIQEGFYDAYLNLTLKSVMMLKWVKTHCNQVSFILKTDDDMYVNIPRLAQYLSQPEILKRRDLIAGSLFCRVVPIKDLSSKWYSPKFMFNEKWYPDYVSGTGYVISGSLVGTLFDNALRVPLFHLEDVFTTGMVAARANVVPENFNLFSYLKHPVDNGCLYRRLVTAHELSPAELRLVWRNVHNPRLNCSAVTLPKIGDPKLKKCRKGATPNRISVRHLPRRFG